MKIEVTNGIDNIAEYTNMFEGKRLGLITGPTGVNKKLKSTIDILHENYNLVALFSPEHGVRGDIQAGVKVEDYIDIDTGIPVYSLYGDKKKITKEMLDKIDLLLFDIQDVGARYYTFLYTLTYAMEGCMENSKPIVVLDRINPLGGKIVQGNILEKGFESFVGKYPIPSRYGLTIGEFALYINSVFKINADLTVVPCKGWNRDLYYDETDLVWIGPSPNMPTIDSAFIYTGTCIFEGTNLSEGRGTTRPFEIIGAPWLNNKQLIKIMNLKDYEGVIFREVYFTPTFSKYANNLCNGIQIHVTDRNKCNPLKLALDILLEIKSMHNKEFDYIPPFTKGGKPFINLLTGSDKVIMHKGPLSELFNKMQVNFDKYLIEKKNMNYIEVINMSTKLNELTLEQKIGQLLVVGFHTRVLDEDLEELIQKYHIGNFIVFQRNIKDSLQLGELNKSIQNLMEKHNKVPAFIGIDQEGGMVTRLFNKATYFPGNMAVAAGIPCEEAYELGVAMGSQLHDVGVNIDFAPVLDVNNNPDNPVIGVRSYGDIPEKVAQYGKNFFKGLQSEKILSCGKHFPGHGNTTVDSHLGLATISSDLSELKKVELVPFVEAINSGIDAIMTAHIMFSSIEKDNLPATLSRTIITGLLKEELGFKGLVVTDCMEMKAIFDNYGIEDATVKALSAGADLLCISHTKEVQIGAFNAIKKAVEAGIISMEILDSKVEKILHFKEKYELYNWRKLSGIIDEGKLVKHAKLAASISEKSITLIKDQKGLLPLKKEGLISISPIPVATSIADDEVDIANLAKVLKNEIGGEYINYNLKEIHEDDIISKVLDKKTIIFGCYNMNLDKSQKNLLDKLIATGKDIVLVVLRNPYDISTYKDEISTILCTYEYTKLSINSLIKVLKGEIVSQGRLPVKVG